jgi:type I restriction enzyme S subunit
MNRWPSKRLGELLLPTEQRDPRAKPTEEFSYVDIASVDNEAKAIGATKRVMGTDAPSRARKVIRDGDVIVSTVRPNLNAVALVPVSLDNEICSTGFSVLRPSPNLLSGYLFAFVRSSGFVSDLVAKTTGANYPAVNDGEVKAVSLPVPPLVEQERIVRLLDDADELQKLRAEADRRTAALIPAVFHEMFGDPEHTRYPVKPLVELVVPGRPITYGILKPGPEIENGVPYVRVVDIKESRLHVEQLKKTTTEIANQYRRSMLLPGDLLVTIRGTVGRTCVVPEELKGANITQDTARLAVLPSIQRTYIEEFVNTPWAQSWMNHHTQGQAVKGINLGDLKKLPVPVPPAPLQMEFAERVSEIRELGAEQAASRRHLEGLFQSMLHRAFNGEL